MRLFSPRFGLAGFLSMLVFWLALAPFAAAGGQEAARIARGGRLYDNWIKEIGSTILHRIEASPEKPVRRPRRCVDCHGWDYRGKDGPASRVGGSSLVKGLLGIKGVTEERLLARGVTLRGGFTSRELNDRFYNKQFGYLFVPSVTRQYRRILIMRHGFHDALRALRRIFRFENPRTHEHRFRAELHHQCRIRRCRDSSRREIRNGKFALRFNFLN